MLVRSGRRFSDEGSRNDRCEILPLHAAAWVACKFWGGAGVVLGGSGDAS